MESLKHFPSPEAESASPEKQELHALEREGIYVFHGTGADVDELEPRQAIDMKRGPDGDPGVFASNKADYAIFMAIVNKYNCHSGARSRAGATFGPDDTMTMKFGMSMETAQQLEANPSATGWVYVFEKNQFVSHGGDRTIEFVSHAPVRPLKKIKVSKRDLPEGIEVFESK